MISKEVPFLNRTRKRKLRGSQGRFLIECIQLCSTPQSSGSSHHFGTAATQQLWGHQRWAAARGAERRGCSCSVSALSCFWKITETSRDILHLENGKHCTHLQKKLKDNTVSCQLVSLSLLCKKQSLNTAGDSQHGLTKGKSCLTNPIALWG